jgi:hypothetical protein
VRQPKPTHPLWDDLKQATKLFGESGAAFLLALVFWLAVFVPVAAFAFWMLA